jgi:hypothetical protein
MEKLIQLIESFAEALNVLARMVSGYKAYFIGVVMIAYGLYTKDNQAVMEGFAVIFLRSGIKSDLIGSKK